MSQKNILAFKKVVATINANPIEGTEYYSLHRKANLLYREELHSYVIKEAKEAGITDALKEFFDYNKLDDGSDIRIPGTKKRVRLYDQPEQEQGGMNDEQIQQQLYGEPRNVKPVYQPPSQDVGLDPNSNEWPGANNLPNSLPAPRQQPAPAPTGQPSPQPSFQPSVQPFAQPAAQPSNGRQPSRQPSQPTLPNNRQDTLSRIKAVQNALEEYVAYVIQNLDSFSSEYVDQVNQIIRNFNDVSRPYSGETPPPSPKAEAPVRQKPAPEPSPQNVPVSPQEPSAAPAVSEQKVSPAQKKRNVKPKAEKDVTVTTPAEAIKQDKAPELAPDTSVPVVDPSEAPTDEIPPPTPPTEPVAVPAPKPDAAKPKVVKPRTVKPKPKIIDQEQLPLEPAAEEVPQPVENPVEEPAAAPKVVKKKAPAKQPPKAQQAEEAPAPQVDALVAPEAVTEPSEPIQAVEPPQEQAPAKPKRKVEPNFEPRQEHQGDNPQELAQSLVQDLVQRGYVDPELYQVSKKKLDFLDTAIRELPEDNADKASFANDFRKLKNILQDQNKEIERRNREKAKEIGDAIPEDKRRRKDEIDQTPLEFKVQLSDLKDQIRALIDPKAYSQAVKPAEKLKDPEEQISKLQEILQQIQENPETLPTTPNAEAPKRRGRPPKKQPEQTEVETDEETPVDIQPIDEPIGDEDLKVTNDPLNDGYSEEERAIPVDKPSEKLSPEQIEKLIGQVNLLKKELRSYYDSDDEFYNRVELKLNPMTLAGQIKYLKNVLDRKQNPDKPMVVRNLDEEKVVEEAKKEKPRAASYAPSRPENIYIWGKSLTRDFR